MTQGCADFRRELEARLRGSSQLTDLGWHEHVLWCASCRSLLEQEEALEGLLATLPEPQLPPAMVERVLARLRSARGGELDALLALDDDVSAPADLASNVRAALQVSRSDNELDALLERDEVQSPDGFVQGTVDSLRLERLLERDTVDVPDDLAQRVIAGLRADRQAGRRPFVLLRGGAGWMRAAALVIASAGLWFVLRTEEAPVVIEQVAQVDEEPVPGLLDALDVLENWDALEAGAELELDAFNGFDAGDEALLELLLTFEEEGDGEDDENG